MRYIFVFIVLLFLCGSNLTRAQLSFPLEEYYHGEIQRRFLSDTSKKDFYSQHLSSKPILQSRSNADSIYTDHSKQYYWITQKLFKENFLIFEGENYWCAVDPVLELELGHDFGIDSMHYKYWNTRGLRVQAKFLDKVGFVTTFYENQAFVPDYQSELFNDHGEFIFNGGLTTYKQVNAVVPGYARTKSFKKTGYDFAFAEGYFTIEPNKYFNLNFGNGNQFIGNGHRSLLLSDFTCNYPFLKLETNFWKNRIQYQVTYASLTNLYRLPYYTTPEATYERKVGAFHYLDVAVNQFVNIGIFEGAVYKQTDSLGSVLPNLGFLNPVILTNSVLMNNSDSNYNSILGLNLDINIGQFNIYAQTVLDESKLAAWQVGFKAYDLMLKNLDFRVEYNHAEQNAYLSNNKRVNFSHYNYSLAHPLTAGFDELVVQLNYQYKRWFAQNHIVYSASFQSDSLNLGTSVLNSTSTVALDFLTRSKIFYNQFEAGYRFNKRYNLQVAVGFIFRRDNTIINYPDTQYFYFAIRTRLGNRRFDL